MRALAVLAASLVLLAMTSVAEAGMRLTLVMVAPEDLAHLARDEGALTKVVLETKPPAGMEMDKEWHGIHFLLTGSAWSTQGPYGQVILGGKEIGPDLGYGPARFLTAEQVKEIAERLRGVTEDQLRRRYDPVKMTEAEIYPQVWRREGESALAWLLQGYRQLVEFYDRAAGQGKAVVLAIV